MYVDREGKLLLCGHVLTRLHCHQLFWLPCEIEALVITSTIKYFSLYLIQSKHHPAVLTGSRSYIQAYQKLCCGQFSASPRLTSFLSTFCCFQASIQHLVSRANMLILPAVTFLIVLIQLARSAPSCVNKKRPPSSEPHLLRS